MNTVGKELSPPSIPIVTLPDLTDKLQEGLPRKIDRKFLKLYYNESLVSKTLSALRFMEFIGEDATPTAAFQQFVEEEGAREQLLNRVIHERYGPILGAVGSLSTATHQQLEDAFTHYYNIDPDTRRKAISFFVHLARSAGIPLSPHIRITKMTSRKNKFEKSDQDSGIEKAEQEEIQILNNACLEDDETEEKKKTISFSSGGLTLSYSLRLHELEEQEQTFLLSLINRLRHFEQQEEQPIPQQDFQKEKLAITFCRGGKVTIGYTADLFEMEEREQTFLLEMINQLQYFEQQEEKAN